MGIKTDEEIVKKITSILTLFKLGRYTMREAFMMILDLVEGDYR